MRIATPIFHIRRRLAWHRFASPAPGCRFRTGRARKLDAMARPSDQYDHNGRISGGMRTSSYLRAMDAYCGNVSWFGRNLADHDDSWRPVGSPLAGNCWWRSRNVRTGLMVRRCSPVWVEARASSTSQEVVLSLIKIHSKTPNFLAQKRLLFASRESAICPDVGLSANGTRWIIGSLTGPKGSNSQFKPRG